MGVADFHVETGMTAENIALTIHAHPTTGTLILNNN